jgi:drug/metabolite transporter (DMT)-like permease
MNFSVTKRNHFTGIGLAVLATFIWSGNFIVARGVAGKIPPVSLAFFRWLTASLVLLPFSFKYLRTNREKIWQNRKLIIAAAVTGVSLFNTFVYIAGHYTSAINLALIGTTSSPVMSIILARIFLKEKIGFLKIAGMITCLAGILLLMSKGNWQNLLGFTFSDGDGWVLLAAFWFAVYNILARKKPADLPAISFLFSTFWIGTALLLPFYLWENSIQPAVNWNPGLVMVILYLGAGASVLSFFLWNIAIGYLGAGRTALFGNLIPLFSTAEAVFFLHEKFFPEQLAGMLLIFSGLLAANGTLFFSQKNRQLPTNRSA